MCTFYNSDGKKRVTSRNVLFRKHGPDKRFLLINSSQEFGDNACILTTLDNFSGTLEREIRFRQ